MILRSCICKIFIFEYFPKIPSEINSTHHFYPILIPSTSYVKIFILFIRGVPGSPRTLKKIKSKNYLTRFLKRFFKLKQKNVMYECPKSAVKILIFEYFPKKILQKLNPRTLFTLFCSKMGPRGPRTLFFFFDIYKGVVKRFFKLKQKKIFLFLGGS